MRQAAIWMGGTIGWLAMVGGLLADEAKDATVRSQTAEVRGGRSEIFPITGYLRQGQSVRIVNEEGGFCGIIPPAGSSSWIEDRAVKPMATPGAARPDKAYVLLDNVSVRLGSERAPGPLPYETVKLPRGTIVRIMGDKAFAEGKEWWPIQPPPAELRYVAKDSLSQQTSTVVSSSPAGTSGPPRSLTMGQSTNPLWTQAQQAEQNHDYARAELLYRQLAGEMAQPGGDHDLAIRCYNRIEQLSRAQGTNWPARQQAPGMLVASRPVTAAPAPVSPVPAPTGSMTSATGWLQRANSYIDGKPAFVLVDNRGQPRNYVLPVPGQTLDWYVGRPIEVTGPLIQRTDLVAGGYISVNRVQLLR